MTSDKELRQLAQKSYGRSCSQIFCKARGDDRGLVLPEDLEAERDDAFGGTWIAAYIWIPDETPEK